MSDIEKRARETVDHIEDATREKARKIAAGADRRVDSIMARPVVKWTLAAFGAVVLVIVIMAVFVGP